MTRFLAVVTGILLSIAASAATAAPATPEEAKALCERAAAYLEQEGEKAYAVFNDKNGPFVDRELYVAVLSHKGIVLAHGANAALIGQDLWEAEDADGQKFMQTHWKVVESEPSGWITFKFTNPATKRIETKRSYIVRVGDVFVTSGAYIK